MLLREHHDSSWCSLKSCYFRMRSKILWGIAILVILVSIGLVARSYIHEDVSLETIPVATVQRGMITINITESGTLQALQSVTLASEINSNRAKIVKLVPEGTYVKQGDLVIEFDQTPFEEEIRKLRHEIDQVKAAITEATENLKLQRVKNESELKDAQVNITAAEAELRNILEGEGIIKLREFELEEERDKAAYEQMKQNVKDLKEMLKSGFITQNELKKAELQLQEAESKYTFTKQKHKIFVEYTRPAQIENAKHKALESKEKLKELREVADYLISVQQANLQKEQARLNGLQEKYQNALKELGKTTILAPIPGLVIYNEIPEAGKTRKIQVGDAVWSHQGLISLPDISKMLVDTQVREIDIHKVELQQNVLVQVDAYPDTNFHGNVHLIGSLAKSDRNLPAGAKYFQVQILLQESDSRLRPGMSARVEILVDRFDDVLYVPLEGVFEKAGQQVCYVVRGNGSEERIVQTGRFNNDFMIIEDGLYEGEQIYLHDPTTFLMR
jgi:HlyD family secretion protein